jgi:hypothetical protein
MFGINATHRRPSRSKHRYDGFRRLSMETLEDRLALTWVGVPPASVPIPTTPVGVSLNSQNDATGVATIATTEVDFYKFTATATGTYTISATTPSSSVDTVLGVFSATGQRLAYNDDIGYPTNTDSRLQLKLFTGTQYFIGITNYSTGSRGAYTWTIDGPAASTPALVDDAYENNDSLLTAYNFGTLTNPKTVGALVMADGVDWYRFTTAATGTNANSVSIAFQNSQGNLQLALYTSTGTFISSSTGTGNTETVSLSGMAAGTYYIDVFGNGGAQNPNYSLTIAAPSPPVNPNPGSGFQITLSMTGLTPTQQSIFQQAAARWSQVITGDLPNATYHGVAVDDLLIAASAVPIDGVNGILGQSAPDAFRAGTDLPYHGFMEFDTADLASIQQSGLLFSVILHEMGHVLGIGTIWTDKGLLSGFGTSDPIFTGVNATAQYNQIFGTTAAGVPVEAGGGPGTAYSHWRESVLGSELMTGYAGPGTNLPLSRITVGSLQDLGYTVNYAAADPYTPGIAGLTSARPLAGSSSSLRAGVVNLTIANGVSSNELAFAPAMTLIAIEPRRPAAQLAVEYAPIDAHLADSAMADTWGSGNTASRHATHSGDQVADDVDHVWSDLGEAWNLTPAFAA